MLRGSASRRRFERRAAVGNFDLGVGLRLGVAGIWTRLQTVPRETLAERAPAFTGMYYENIRSDPPEFSAWPLSP